jgi:hypothetical protein
MAGSSATGDTWRDKKSQSVPCSVPFEVPKDTSLYFFVSTVKKLSPVLHNYCSNKMH